MREGWELTTVANVCSRVTSGGTPRRQREGYYTYEGLGTPWAKTKELTDGYVSETEERITERAIAESAAKILPRDTVLMAMYGATVGKLGILARPMACNQACCALIVDSGVADHRFLFYRLLLDRPRLVGLANGAAQQNLSGSVIRDFKFPCPPLDEQRRIAGVLGALDDLIETNERLAQASDALTETLWWQLIGRRARSARSTVKDVAHVVLGGTPSRARPEYWGGEVAWINSGKANEFRVIEPSERITPAGYRSSSSKMMPRGTTLVAITGATLGQVSRLEVEACGNQSLVGVFADSLPVNDHLYYAIRAELPALLGHATGGAQQHVNKGNVEGLLIHFPNRELLECWHVSASPLLATTRELLIENSGLRRTRDELLPLLMSGAVSPGELAVAS